MLGRGEGVSVAPNDALMGFYLGSEREQCAGVPTPRITKVSTKKKQDWEFRPFLPIFFGHVGKFWVICKGVSRAMFRITIVLGIEKTPPQ